VPSQTKIATAAGVFVYSEISALEAVFALTVSAWLRHA